MVTVEFKIASIVDAQTAMNIIAGILDSFEGESLPSTATPTRGRGRPRKTAAADPVAAYVDAGGAMPDTAEPAPPLAAADPAPPAAPVAAEPASPAAPATVTTQDTAPVDGFAMTPEREKALAGTRAIGQDKGVLWLRSVLDGAKAKKLSDLTTDQLLGVIELHT